MYVRDYLWCMSLLEWLTFWSKFYRIPLFWNTVSEYPPPTKIEIWADLGTLTFQFQNTPPPPAPPTENWNLGRSWHFDFSVSEYPPNWNLGRSWHFDFSVSEYPPPQIEIWEDLGTLRLFSFRTMCGKLPHVETLSSPDNYSLFCYFNLHPPKGPNSFEFMSVSWWLVESS